MNVSHRVLGFPFHFLDNHRAMNVRPKNYSWPDFYDQVIGLDRAHLFLARDCQSLSGKPYDDPEVVERGCRRWTSGP